MDTLGLSEGWIDYAHRLVDAVKSKSNCPRRKVGAVIMDDDHNIIATGYNGVPRKFPHCDVCYGGERISGHGLDKLPCLHAEENAIMRCSPHQRKGSTIFVSITPCNMCLKKIIQAGIQYVYAFEMYHMTGEDERLGLYLLDHAKKANGFRMFLHKGGNIF